MASILERLLRQPNPKKAGTFIVPNGTTWTEPCRRCGETPKFEPHQIYGTPICEDCFWDEPYDEPPSPTLPDSED